MKIKVKNGMLHIPAKIREKAHLSKDGNYEMEVCDDKIIIYTQIKTDLKGKAKSVRNFGFTGMWADREDMKESAEWVREQRAGWKKRTKI